MYGSRPKTPFEAPAGRVHVRQFGENDESWQRGNGLGKRVERRDAGEMEFMKIQVEGISFLLKSALVACGDTLFGLYLQKHTRNT